MGRRRFRGPAVGLAAALGLAACGAGDPAGPSAEATPTLEATTTADGGPAPTTEASTVVAATGVRSP